MLTRVNIACARNIKHAGAFDVFIQDGVRDESACINPCFTYIHICDTKLKCKRKHGSKKMATYPFLARAFACFCACIEVLHEFLGCCQVWFWCTFRFSEWRHKCESSFRVQFIVKLERWRLGMEKRDDLTDTQSRALSVCSSIIIASIWLIIVLAWRTIGLLSIFRFNLQNIRKEKKAYNYTTLFWIVTTSFNGRVKLTIQETFGFHL